MQLPGAIDDELVGPFACGNGRSARTIGRELPHASPSSIGASRQCGSSTPSASTTLEHGTDLRTIALYTEPDRHSMFVREADEAHDLGAANVRRPDGTPAGQLPRPRPSGAGAGRHRSRRSVGRLGFRVRARRLRRSVSDASGSTFIGPDADVMRRLGDKITSKQIAEASGVPVARVEWWSGRDRRGGARPGRRIGYPVLSRPLRAVADVASGASTHPTTSPPPSTSARAEARHAFGDDTVFVETTGRRGASTSRCRSSATTHGTVWAVGVRDCSVQRRNQKIIEEAPSPSLDAEQTRQVCDAAVRLGTGRRLPQRRDRRVPLRTRARAASRSWR